MENDQLDRDSMSSDQVFERSALSMCLEIDHRIDRRKDHKKSQAKGLVIHELKRSGQETALCSSEGLNCKRSQPICP